MTKLNQTALILFSVSLLASCDFINNTLTYKDTTDKLVESIINEDYDNTLNYFALENDYHKKTPFDTLKSKFSSFRKLILEHFGDNLEYTFMTASRTFSTNNVKATEVHTTDALIQFENKKEFGVLELVFDNESNKIISIKPLDIKERIPNMLLFWLFGLPALCILIFNLLVIRKIKKSRLKRKWLKCLCVFVFNAPTITYSAVTGLSFGLLSFQLMLGVGVNYMGYLNAAWAIGLPLGGLYWLWKLRDKAVDDLGYASPKVNTLD
jgi:hypothetical protein